jgi:ectoine hydroxylase-related dioxygenase (phytanoyl-CoA dioxygenase family)
VDLEPHPLNQGFTWTDRQGPFRRLSPEQVRRFDVQGFVVLEGVFDAATLHRVTEAIDPLEARTEGFLRTRERGRLFIARAGELTFTPHLVLRSETLRAFCAGPFFQDVCHDLVGPDARLYWEQAVYKKPGDREGFPWHQDNGYTYVEPQQYLTCWIPLEDATLANGCPWVLPGLHRRGTLAHRMSDLGWVCLDDPGDRAVAAPVRAGDVLVFSSLTPHCTGPNTTGNVRKAYIVQFAPDGAVIHRPSPGGEVVCERADDPDRQFRVLVDGRAPAGERP